MVQSTGSPAQYNFKSCSAMKTHNMKPPEPRCCADVKGGLELCNYRVGQFYAPCKERTLYMVCCFVAELMWLRHVAQYFCP